MVVCDVFVKLDSVNAFKCCTETIMLNIVNEVVPEIYCFCYSAYRYHPTSQFSRFSIFAQVGPNKVNQWLVFYSV